MKIGVLALQGAFAEHIDMLRGAGIDAFEIRERPDFDSADAVIIPGGESTTQAKLLSQTGLLSPLRDAILEGMPVFGTCAGMILLAKSVEEGNNYVPTAHDARLATMDITVMRNAYGRQLGSFAAEGDVGSISHFPMVFIRAPYITSAADDVEILAKAGDHIVAARQGNQLVTAFHPELTTDARIHLYFADIVKQSNWRR